jgi:hypothetical protein
MVMVDENYFDKFLCGKEQSKKMKELLGFNKPCLGGLDKNDNWCWHPDSDIILDIPLKSQFFDWIEEVFNITAYIKVNYSFKSYTGGFRVRMFEYDEFKVPIEPLFLVKDKSKEEVESELIDFLIEWIYQRVLFYEYKEKNDFFNETIINKEHLFGVKEKYKKGDVVIWRGQDPAIYTIKSKCNRSNNCYEVILSEKNDISLSVENLRLATEKEKEFLGDLEFTFLDKSKNGWKSKNKWKGDWFSCVPTESNFKELPKGKDFDVLMEDGSVYSFLDDLPFLEIIGWRDKPQFEFGGRRKS